MKSFVFKSNLKCEGCIEQIQLPLNQISGIDHWEVDLLHPDKLIILHGELIDYKVVISKIGEAGYRLVYLPDFVLLNN